jgi:hypothetical protein
VVPRPKDEDLERPAGSALDLSEACAIYRQMALYDMAFEVQFGLEMSFVRTFAVPSIAKVLAGTGEIAAQPLKRWLDTALMMYELIDAGLEAPRARSVIRMLNQVHRGLPITEEQYSYVLTTFIVPALRFMDSYGWRPVTVTEKEAVTVFYRRVGQLMGLKWLPGNYEEATTYLDSYERANLAPSPEGASLMQATQSAMATRMPRGARWASPTLVRLMLDDRLCKALSLPVPAPTARRAFALAMAARRAVVRRRPVRTEPRFRPGRSGKDVYPHGYELEDLGPPHKPGEGPDI